MSNRVIEFVKEHPLSIAAGVLGVIILYVLYSSASASGGVAIQQVAVDPNAAAYAAQSQQLAYSAANHSNDLSAQLALAQIGANAQGAHDVVTRDVSLAGIQAEQNIQTTGQQSQIDIAQINADTNQKQIDAAMNLGLAQAATYAHIADVNAATTIGVVQANTAAQIVVANDNVTAEIARVVAAGKGSSASIGAGPSGITADIIGPKQTHQGFSLGGFLGGVVGALI